MECAGKDFTVGGDSLEGVGETFAFEVFGHLAKTLGGVGGGLFLLESPGAEKGGGAQGGKEIASSGVMRVGMRMRVRVGVRVSMAGMERVVFHVHLSSANSAELITLGAMDAIDAIGCVEWPLRDYLLRVKAARAGEGESL